MSDGTDARDQSEIITDAVARQIVQDTKVYFNVTQDTLVITEDKVRLCLIHHLKRVEARSGWVAPLGILVTVAAALLTTTFRNFLLEAAVWKAIFILGGVLVFIWLAHAMVKAWRTPTIEDIVSEMKRAGTAQAKGETLEGP